jgi:Flp pilus assembly protein TadD
MGTVAVLAGGAAAAVPFLPRSDAQVLERVPPSTDRAVRALRTVLVREPQRLDLALDLAQRSIRVGRAQADPRYFGYAQAALGPWWDQDDPPPAVLLLRATLRQNRHEFDAALQDLAKVLHVQPDNAQAWLTQAVILAVRGDYAAARRSCGPLLRLSSALVTVACWAQSAGRDAQRSYQALQQVLQRSAEASPEERLWALTLAAELATRLGWHQAAETHFRQALALGLPDSYLLGAYADFLLDCGRAQEVQTLLGEQTRQDGLLLRLALAEQRLGWDRDLAAHTAELQARFAASARRGDSVHLREQARFSLHLLGDAAEALRLALANWRVQKEPWDLRLLLEAAAAAGQPAVAEEALDWLQRSGLQDAALTGLVRRVAERRP